MTDITSHTVQAADRAEADHPFYAKVTHKMKALERMTDGGARRGAPRRAAGTAGAVALALALLGTGGLAQAQAQAAPQDTAMVKLIRGLIKSGAIDKATGEALLAQAETEAYAASQAAQKSAAAAPAGAAVAGAAAGAAAGAGFAAEPGDVRIPYISQTTRDQIRDEVKNEVMAQAKSEG